METTAVALALSGSIADWPARFFFKVLEELDNQKKNDDNNKKPLPPHNKANAVEA